MSAVEDRPAARRSPRGAAELPPVPQPESGEPVAVPTVGGVAGGLASALGRPRAVA